MLALLPTVACSLGAPVAPHTAAADLGATSWQLVKFQGGDGELLIPDDPAKYTITFGTDGSVSARIDCNRARYVDIFRTEPTPVRAARAHARHVLAGISP